MTLASCSENLGCRRYNDEAVIALAANLKKNTVVELLFLENSLLNDSKVSLLAESLQENTTLLGLSLRGNRIHGVAAYSLSTVSLTNLNLSDNPIKPEGITAITYLLSTHQCLQYLALCRNRTNDAQAEEMALALGKNSVLTALWLSGNKIGDRGATSLFQALLQNTTLQCLDLDNNEVRDAMTMQCLARNDLCLHSLDLSDNPLLTPSRTMLAITHVIRNSSLRRLILGGDCHNSGRYVPMLYTTQGMEEVNNAMATNTSLTELSLYGQDFNLMKEVPGNFLNVTKMFQKILPIIGIKITTAELYECIQKKCQENRRLIENRTLRKLCLAVVDRLLCIVSE